MSKDEDTGIVMPLYECYTRNKTCLTGVDHPTDHYMTPNYFPDMLKYYPGYWNKELDPWPSSVV